MARIAEQVGIPGTDPDFRAKIIEAGDGNFFDAQTGLIYVKKSKLVKYGYRVIQDGFFTKYGKKGDFSVIFDFKPRGDGVAVTAQTYQKNAAASMIGRVNSHGPAGWNKDIVVRYVEDFYKPLPAGSVGIYIHPHGGAAAPYGLSYLSGSSYSKAKIKFMLPHIPGVYESPWKEGETDDGGYPREHMIMLAKDKILYNGWSYDSLYYVLVASLLKNFYNRAAELKGTDTVKPDTLIAIEVDNYNAETAKKKKGYLDLINAANTNIESYQTHIRGQLLVLEKNKALADAVNDKLERKDVFPEVIDAAINPDGVSYVISGLKHRGVIIPDLRVTIGAASIHIVPVDLAKKHPAPWLWFDEAQKDYNGVAANADMKAFFAGGINLSAAITAIRHVCKQQKYDGYEERYQNFIKENGMKEVVA